ncbi:hypothetical protein EV361DRAFT_957164 [Lentinula raphanica]|nr:hypothetical protein EV361DRAFT_957164 [Lentinula raphanica]
MGSIQRTANNRVTGEDTVKDSINEISTNSASTAINPKEKAARDFFASKAAILGSNQLITRDDVYGALLKATHLPKKDVETALKAVEHGVVLLKKMDEKKLQNEIAAKVVSSVESSIEKLGLAQQIQHQIQQVKTELNERLDSMANSITGNGEKIDRITKDNQPVPQGGTYAAAARATSPTGLAAPTQAMARQRIRAHAEVKGRQVLLINTGNDTAKELEDKEPEQVLRYLNDILIKMGALNKGTFISVSKLRGHRIQ